MVYHPGVSPLFKNATLYGYIILGAYYGKVSRGRCRNRADSNLLKVQIPRSYYSEKVQKVRERIFKA